jgi:hypothetical protein
LGRAILADVLMAAAEALTKDRGTVQQALDAGAKQVAERRNRLSISGLRWLQPPGLWHNRRQGHWRMS